MQVKLQRVNKGSHYEATAPSSEVKVHIDGPASIGGEGKGSSPMELVLMALGGCSVFDLGEILSKQRQVVEDIQVEVTGSRREESPRIYTAIHITFLLKGNIDEDKANKAAELAVKKYCSVHDMLAAGGVEITYEVKINS